MCANKPEPCPCVNAMSPIAGEAEIRRERENGVARRARQMVAREMSSGVLFGTRVPFSICPLIRETPPGPPSDDVKLCLATSLIRLSAHRSLIASDAHPLKGKEGCQCRKRRIE